MAPDRTLDWLTTGEGEAVLWSGGPRIRTVVWEAVVVVVLVAAALGGAIWLGKPLYGLVAPLVGFALVGYSYLGLVNTDYVLTDDAVYRKEGIVGERVSRVTLSRIQNTDLQKGVLGETFGYGNIRVDTAGSSGVELVFGKVENPERVREILMERTKRAGSGGLSGGGGGSTESLERALEEARALRQTAESLEETFVEGRP